MDAKDKAIGEALAILKKAPRGQYGYVDGGAVRRAIKVLEAASIHTK